MPEHKTITFPKSRVATLDVCAVGLRKHHLAARRTYVAVYRSLV
ncbi:MAG: hypothetical protein ABR545_13250 [Cyclonatronaceae bacterium]